MSVRYNAVQKVAIILVVRRKRIRAKIEAIRVFISYPIGMYWEDDKNC